MAKLWQRLIPHYGNYGGPGWSGGAWMDNYTDVDWNVEPADSLDECFHDHDRKYQASIKEEAEGIINNEQMHQLWIKADEDLIEDINKISPDPQKWPRPPTKNSNKYAWFYRKAAMVGFWVKIRLCTLRYGKKKANEEN